MIKIKAKDFYICFLLSAMSVLTIILSGRFYVDDLGRSQLGYLWWGSNGRPLSDYIMTSLNFNSVISDIYPIPQILSVCIICLVALYLSYRYCSGSLIASSTLSVCMISSPFFLESISYRFDSVTMALSLAVAMIPSMLTLKNLRSHFFVCCASTMAALSLYQASLPALVVSIIFSNAIVKEYGYKYILTSIVGLAAGYIIYIKMILPFVTDGHYTDSHAGVVSLDLDGFNIFIGNAIRYIDLISMGLTKSVKYTLIPIVVIGFGYAIKLSLCKESGALKFLSIISVLLTPVIPLAVLSILENPVFMPRTTLSYVSLVAYGILVFNMLCMKHFRRASLLGVFPAYCMAMIATVYGNTLKAQDEFEKPVIGEIRSFLLNDSNKEFTDIAVEGGMPMSSIYLHNSKKYPLLTKLVGKYLNDTFIWGGYQMRMNGIKIGFISNPDTHKKTIEGINNGKPIYHGGGFNIYKYNNTAVISFKR